MADKFGADCPCGFTFTTPHGQEDAIAVTTLHVQRVHPDMGTSREEILKAIVKR